MDGRGGTGENDAEVMRDWGWTGDGWDCGDNGLERQGDAIRG